MKKRNHCRYSYFRERNVHFGLAMGRNALVFLLFIVLPIQSFAQPLAEGKDKFLGCSTSSAFYRNLFEYWNQITPGNAGKWGSVERVQGQYNWTDLDKIYNYAVNRNLPFKEHTLVWGNQQPSWINSLNSTDQRSAVEDWIREVGERYPEMAFVDVVNEPFNAPPSYKNALGGDGTTGWDWVITAFELARQYCAPDVKLHLNEYNILHSNTQTNNYIDLIRLLMDRNLIDGIGVQGHYFEFRSDIDATTNIYVWDINTIKSNLDRLADIGLPIYITEFDIDEIDDTNQLEQYQIYFPIFWSHPRVMGMTLWGYIQGDCWSAHPNTYLLLADGTERPALQWLRTYIRSPQPPVIFSPDAVVDVPRNPILMWYSSVSATSYHVQVASNSVFTTVIVDTALVDTLLQLNPLEANKRYYWHVSGANEYGTSEYSATASFMTGDQITNVDEIGRIPTKFRLMQNYPNPFNPVTTISFKLPQRSFIRLFLVDVLGKQIMNIAEGHFEAGTHSVQLNAINLSSGVYFYRLKAGTFVSTEKLIIMK